MLQYKLEDALWLPDSPNYALRLRGWCFISDRDSAIVAFQALSGKETLVIAAPHSRPDVRDHFDGDIRAETTGFDLLLPALNPRATVELVALLADGKCLPFHSQRVIDLPNQGPAISHYPDWAVKFDPDPAASTQVASMLKFSIIFPVYNPAEAHLRAALDSVFAQHYPRWELCIVDDGSSAPCVSRMIAKYAHKDPRIRIKRLPKNIGIARASNAALATASGDYVVMLDHDDILRPHALAEFARRLTREPDLDALYSDEDKITADGRRVIPFLKPDFSPEFLLGVMYIGHALCVRTGTARAAGGFDPSFDGVQDYEFFLRVTRQTRRIGHIPRILYHWRQSPTSSALQGNIKGDMDRKQADAVQAHLRAQGDSRQARPLGGHRVRLESTNSPATEIVPCPADGSPLDTLRRAATASSAEVLVLLTTTPLKQSESWLRELAVLAARPDSGCVAPLLLSREGWVYESGRTTGPADTLPLMRGFDPTGDGYHGSLPCSREVGAVSSLCVAVRRELLLGAVAPPDEDWFKFCTHLRSLGLFNRVCPAAQVVIDASWQEPALATPPTVISDGYYNPHFDPQHGDYSLAQRVSPIPAAHLTDAPLHWHIDQPDSWRLPSRCVIIRGWCFAADPQSVRAIRLRTADRMLSGVTGLPRPDVKAALPEAPDDNTGFEIRATLPTGCITISIETELTDGTWHQLLTRPVEVKRQWLPRWLGGGSVTELIAFQMPAHMAYPARPVRRERFPATTASAAQPKFSVVTPSYNHARFLGETMRSVLEQDAAVDYIVQDGKSTDGSKALIERFASEQGAAPLFAAANPACPVDASWHHGVRPPASAGANVLGSRQGETKAKERGARLVAWTSEPDAGQADAIMKGFAKTSGGSDDIMAWINSDDFYLPGALAYVADYFARHPEVDVIYGHRIVVNEESREIARWFLPKHDPEVLRLNDFVPQETLFWRRRIWDKVGGLDLSFKFALDWDLLLRFQAAGARIVRVPWFLACFRVHAAQKTSALMHSTGQDEITRLRERTQGRPFPPQELERNPRLLRYLRRSAFIQWLWSLGLRAP